MTSDSKYHSYLRRLVGQSMMPEKINNAIPALVETANEQIDNVLAEPTMVMENALTNFTLDVARNQILGLDLKEEEIPEFYKATQDWIAGVLNPRVLFLPGIKFTKSYKARSYLVSKIEDKLERLERNGPDGSTISAMYFARDEEGESKRLSHAEIIDNALLLILAGSETAASSLTVATLALGLNPKVFQKLKDEQKQLITNYGTTKLSREKLDKDCPYLDAVIKETMRIKPLPSGGPARTVYETLTVDGKQIPKGYGVVFNTRITHEQDPIVKKNDGSHMDVARGFIPERWLNEDTKPTEYMPFGYGPRYCLGANLAMAEMKVFLALFARRVDFELVNMNPDNVTWKRASIMPKPEDGAVIAAHPAALMVSGKKTSGVE